ncbi:hypothetical protein BX589_1141, partial [Paraburkholderia fungorum]
MNALPRHPEDIHPDLWTYTRGVHSLRAKSVKAFCGGVAKDSPFRCM